MNQPDVERIRLAAACDALRIDTVARIGSTNAALLEAPFGEAPAPPRLLAAAAQTAGRGRRGRSWLGAPDRSAAFSLAFERRVRFEPPPAALAVAVGAASAAVLVRWAPDVQLKWPNDLMRAWRKFGGILVECRRGAPHPASGEALERLVVGIGLNLLAPPEGDAVGQPACGLFDDGALPQHAAETVIGTVAGAVVAATGRFLAQGFAAFAEEWARFDALAGERVAVHDGARVVDRGVALGLDPGGGLRVRTSAGVRVLSSGEVSLRRLDAVGRA